jgi:hypothetical protein
VSEKDLQDQQRGHQPQTLRERAPAISGPATIFWTTNYCRQPINTSYTSIIAAAIYAGHKYARELDCEIDHANPAKYDRVFFVDS